MGRKKKKYKPIIFCYYCDRKFENEKVLIQHQRAKHFKCTICHKRLGSAHGMMVHVFQVHKKTIEKVPHSKPDRDSFEVNVFGMGGVPEDLINEKLAERGDPPTKIQKLDHDSKPTDENNNEPNHIPNNVAISYPIIQPPPPPISQFQAPFVTMAPINMIPPMQQPFNIPQQPLGIPHQAQLIHYPPQNGYMNQPIQQHIPPPPQPLPPKKDDPVTKTKKKPKLLYHDELVSMEEKRFMYYRRREEENLDVTEINIDELKDENVELVEEDIDLNPM